MNPVAVRVTLNVVGPHQPGVHHRLRPRSLEDKIRIKQMMIQSHVLLGVNCPRHNQGFVVDHYISVCNCSGYSFDELYEMFQETYVDFIFDVERYFVTTEFPVFPARMLRSMIVHCMNAFIPLNLHSLKSCNVDFLKLTNLTMVYKEVTDNHRDAQCGSKSTGFLFTTPPLGVPVDYTGLPLANFRGL